MDASEYETVRRTLRQQLQSLQRAGLTHLARVESPEPVPLARTPSAAASESRSKVVKETQSPATESQPSSSSTEAPSPRPQLQPKDLVVTSAESTPRSTFSRAERSEQLALLEKEVAACKLCQELATTRTQTVFGVGNPEAKIMFVGEAPGADEDKQGEPFVGRAGQLMNKIITACNMKREDIYICNILRCRPPGNRNPSPTEAANCRPFLEGQIRIVDPDYIVCWGTVAAQNLLNSTETIGRLRGSFKTYGHAKVLCTYHPSYLLRNPSAKKPVWEDMQFLFQDMGIELSSQ